MNLAVALMARRSLGFRFYAATLNGWSVEELAAEYHLPVYRVAEQVTATRLIVAHQVTLSINTSAAVFRDNASRRSA
jgi:hypothetical protein